LACGLLAAAILARCLRPPEVFSVPSPGTVKAEDMTGRTVLLDGPPRRIMMLTPVSWHYLLIEGTDQHILMIPPYMRREISLSPLSRIFPALADRPLAFLDNKSAAAFSVEQSMFQRPDAVLAWDYLSGDFDRAGVQGLIRISADSGEKERLFKLLGEMTDKSGRVKNLTDRTEEKKRIIFGEALKITSAREILIIDDDSFSLGTDRYYKRFNFNAGKIHIRNLAEKTGGRNGILNVESLLSADPEIILINHFLLASSTIRVEDIYSDERLQGLKAVRNRRVYHLPRGAARLEGPLEEHLALLWLLQTLRPEAPSSLNLRAEIRESYLNGFGYCMSDDEIDEWLRLKENLQSAGYAGFIRRAPASSEGGAD
jgi:iron complex transport system substrate-binding protein